MNAPSENKYTLDCFKVTILMYILYYDVCMYKYLIDLTILLLYLSKFKSYILILYEATI